MGKPDSIENNKAFKITYSSLFWLFFFGSIAGFILEGLWRILKKGVWENHSSTVLGPFCIVYGFGIMAIFFLSTYLRKRNPVLQFVLFALAGAFVEYTCSYIQYAVFGTRSWDYSNQLFNVNGRIDLKMTVIWGILGTVVSRFLYPFIVKFLERTDGKFWRACCVVLSVFMFADLALSAAAVMRWKVRVTLHTPPANAFDVFLDSRFDNKTMKKIYSNMKFIK